MSLFIAILSFRGIKKITIFFFFFKNSTLLESDIFIALQKWIIFTFFFLIPNVFLFPLLANVLLLKATEQVHMT